MKMKITGCALLLAASSLLVVAQEIKIESFSQNGLLIWTNSSLNTTCRVEWASTANGPWHGSWESLTNLVVTNPVMTVSVPMFYRIVATVPMAPILTNITPQTALEMISTRLGNPDFVVIDVRTPGEYAAGHIKQALNIDYYGTTFQNQINALDKKKAYLIYCGSGTRSGKTLEIMKNVGFTQVYNLMYGYSTFATQSGAKAYVEP